jgi:hypothetical protein
MSQEKREIFYKVKVSVILSKNCNVRVSYSERFPRYSYFTVQFQIVDKKEMLRTVSNTSIYFSSDKVGTVYLV